MELSPASVSRCIEETRLGFMYAPYYHPVMKSVKSVRSALQVSFKEALGLSLHVSAALQPSMWHTWTCESTSVQLPWDFCIAPSVGLDQLHKKS